MSKQHLFLPILIYFSCNAVTTAQIIGGSIVNVPNLGAIRGKEINATANCSKKYQIDKILKIATMTHYCQL